MWIDGKRIKTTTRDAIPAVLLTVGVDAVEPHEDERHAGRPFVCGGIGVTWSRRDGERWGVVRSQTMGTWSDFWPWVDSTFVGRSRVYIVSPNALDDLTLLHFWDEVSQGRSSFRRGKDGSTESGSKRAKSGRVQHHPLVFGDRADIIGFQRAGTSYRWVSASNWADLSLTEMAKQVEYPAPAQAAEGERWRRHGWPAADVAAMLHSFMRRSFAWWVDNGCGTWKDTPGAAAYSSWLRQGGERDLIKHEHAESLRLEDRACFGGRAQAWFFGPIGNPKAWSQYTGAPTPRQCGGIHRRCVHRYDVRAMYPTLLRDHMFPRKLMDYERAPSVKRLASRIQQVLAIAAVRIRTDQPIYPLRTEQGPTYPVGQFDTVLSTPELALAISRGHLERVWEASYYTPGRPYAKWAGWALGLRDAMKREGDSAGELWVKTFSNAFGGRLGRKPIGWEDDVTVVPRVVWGTWPYDHPDFAVPQLYRSICGRVQRLKKEDDRPGTLAAGYAHLTAYGRVFMQHVRESIGTELCYWQDTDGLLVSDVARAEVEASPWYDANRYGRLRHEGTYHQGQLITAKHYWLDGQWTLSGVATGFATDKMGHAGESRIYNPVREAKEPVHHATYQYAQRIDLGAIDPGVKIGSDGWLVPPTIWVGEPAADSIRPADGVSPFWALPQEHREYAQVEQP